MNEVANEKRQLTTSVVNCEHPKFFWHVESGWNQKGHHMCSLRLLAALNFRLSLWAAQLRNLAAAAQALDVCFQEKVKFLSKKCCSALSQVDSQVLPLPWQADSKRCTPAPNGCKSAFCNIWCPLMVDLLNFVWTPVQFLHCLPNIAVWSMELMTGGSQVPLAHCQQQCGGSVGPLNFLVLA